SLFDDAPVREAKPRLVTDRFSLVRLSAQPRGPAGRLYAFSRFAKGIWIWRCRGRADGRFVPLGIRNLFSAGGCLWRPIFQASAGDREFRDLEHVYGALGPFAQRRGAASLPRTPWCFRVDVHARRLRADGQRTWPRNAIQ